MVTLGLGVVPKGDVFVHAHVFGCGGCRVQHPEGSWPWKVCAPGPIWAPYSLPDRACSFRPESPLILLSQPGMPSFHLAASHLSCTTFHQEFLLMCSVGLVLGICLFNQPLLPPSAQECSRLSTFEGEKLYLSPLFSSTPGMCGLGQLLSPCC